MDVALPELETCEELHAQIRTKIGPGLGSHGNQRTMNTL